MSKLVLILAILGSLLVQPAPSQAALIDTDWQASGDSRLLLDTSSGLEWLDHSLTMDMSYNDVVASLGAGGTFAEFRYATQGEVLRLWSQAGITDTNWQFVDVGEWNVVKNLADRLGTSILFELTPTGLVYGTHALGIVEGGSPLPATQRWAMELSYHADGVQTRTSRDHYFLETSYHDEHYASYLVRAAPVPLPPASILFCSALAGILVGFARIKI